jgi:hypothetical protein
MEDKGPHQMFRMVHLQLVIPGPEEIRRSAIVTSQGSINEGQFVDMSLDLL